MLNELKTRSLKKSLFGTILMVVIGIVCLVIATQSVITILHGHYDFESLEPDEIDDKKIVDASVTTNFGSFIEEYEKNTKTGATRTTNLYYVIWTGDDESTDFRYIGVKMPTSYQNVMDAMADATYNYEVSNPVEVSGALCKMDDEELRYFKEYFLESGWTEEEFEEGTLPYFIDYGALVGASGVFFVVVECVGIFLIILAVIRMIYALSGGYLKKFQRELDTLGCPTERADMEFHTAPLIAGDLKIGRTFTFYFDGNHPHIILNDKIVWAYQSTTTHRTNGIKTGTTYEVIIYTIEKKAIHASVSSQSDAVTVLDHMANTMPWVVLGYTKDIEKLFKNDFQNFLQGRYYTMPHPAVPNVSGNMMTPETSYTPAE